VGAAIEATVSIHVNLNSLLKGVAK